MGLEFDGRQSRWRRYESLNGDRYFKSTNYTGSRKSLNAYDQAADFHASTIKMQQFTECGTRHLILKASQKQQHAFFSSMRLTLKRDKIGRHRAC